MTTYPVLHLRGEITYAIVHMTFFSVVFAIVFLPVLTGETPSSEYVGRIAFGVVFVLAILGGEVFGLRSVRVLHITMGGTIEFTRRWGTVRMPASDIRSLTGKYRADYDGHLTIWRLTVTTSHGTFKFDQFREVTHFADQVRSLNPIVTIDGIWPMVSPPPSYESGERHTTDERK